MRHRISPTGAKPNSGKSQPTVSPGLHEWTKFSFCGRKSQHPFYLGPQSVQKLGSLAAPGTHGWWPPLGRAQRRGRVYLPRGPSAARARLRTDRWGSQGPRKRRRVSTLPTASTGVSNRKNSETASKRSFQTHLRPTAGFQRLTQIFQQQNFNSQISC